MVPICHVVRQDQEVGVVDDAEDVGVGGRAGGAALALEKLDDGEVAVGVGAGVDYGVGGRREGVGSGGGGGGGRAWW